MIGRGSSVSAALHRVFDASRVRPIRPSLGSTPALHIIARLDRAIR
jgi:hypothetical protein